jgi:hypothetical protein
MGESFAAILHDTLFFVSTQPGCQKKKLSKKRDFLQAVSIWSFSQKDKSNDKNTPNTLERNSQKLLTRSTLLAIFLHSHAAMTSSLECVHRRRSHCNMFCIISTYKAQLPYTSNVRPGNKYVYNERTHTRNNLLEHGTC